MIQRNCSFPKMIAANPPTNLNAVRVDPTSIQVSWTAPASGATVMGYRIYYYDGTNMSSVEVSANATGHNLAIPHPQSRLRYSIAIVALSFHLPSTMVGLIVGKQKMLFVLLPFACLPTDRFILFK